MTAPSWPERELFFKALVAVLYPEEYPRGLTNWRRAFLEQWAQSRYEGADMYDPDAPWVFGLSRPQADFNNEVAETLLEIRGGELAIIDEVLRHEMILDEQLPELVNTLRDTGAPLFADMIDEGWRPLAAGTDTLHERILALEGAVGWLSSGLADLLAERAAAKSAAVAEAEQLLSDAMADAGGREYSDWPVDA